MSKLSYPCKEPNHFFAQNLVKSRTNYTFFSYNLSSLVQLGMLFQDLNVLFIATERSKHFYRIRRECPPRKIDQGTTKN